MQKSQITTIESQNDSRISRKSQIFQQNQLLNKLIRQLVKQLLYQFIDHLYDSNSVLRLGRQLVQEYPQCYEKQEILNLWPDIQKFMWNLAISPKYWIIMFQNQSFFANQEQTIDMNVFTSRIYRFVMQEAQKLTPKAHFLSSIISNQILVFLEEISRQVCQTYQQAKTIITEEIQSLQYVVENSKLVNFYLIYKLLAQISEHCTKKVSDYLSTGLFGHLQPKYIETFTKYVLQKHQVLKMNFNSQNKQKQSDQSLINIIERIKTQTNIRWRSALRQDGQSGIIVEFIKQQGGVNQNYLIKLDEQGNNVNVTNCNTLNKVWKVTESAQKNYQIINLVSSKNKLVERLRNSPTQLKDITLKDHVGSMGGALGKCLANIKDYDSVGDFMVDLSKKSLMNGTFNYIATNVPLIGVLMASGGYTFSLYSIFSNKAKNKKKKMQELGFVTVDVASSIGSGLLGAAIGQSVIPIPFLGAFLGGFVGSFVGQVGARALTNKLQSIRFKSIIRQLQLTIQLAGYWQVNKKTLGIFGISSEHFYNSIPSYMQGRLGADKFWFAVIAFTLLCFNESKKRIKFFKEKTKQLMEKQQKQVQIKEIKKSMTYNPSLDLLVVSKYLQDNRIQLSGCYLDLQNLIQQIFSRIK